MQLQIRNGSRYFTSAAILDFEQDSAIWPISGTGLKT